MANEIVVETTEGENYLGHRGGEETVNGDKYLILENPRKIEVSAAKPVDGAEHMKILKKKIKRVRKLDEI